MKKILIIMLIMLCNVMQRVGAEQLPIKDWELFGPETYPFLYKYLDEYKDRLYENFNPDKTFATDHGNAFRFTIKKDGTTTLKPYKSMETETEYVYTVIKNTPPKPLYPEMEYDEIKIRVGLFKTKYDKINVRFSGGREPYTAWITIYKDYRHNNKSVKRKLKSK